MAAIASGCDKIWFVVSDRRIAGALSEDLTLAVTQGCTPAPGEQHSLYPDTGLASPLQGCATSGDGCKDLVSWAAGRKGLQQPLTLGVVLLLELTHITRHHRKKTKKSL